MTHAPKQSARIIVTSGEPAGIGPDIVLDLALQNWPVQLVICGDKSLLLSRFQSRHSAIELVDFDPYASIQPSTAQQLTVQHIPLLQSSHPGVLNPANSAYVLAQLDYAILNCKTGLYQGMVTAPIHKGVINQAQILPDLFTGHTEYLAEQTNTEQVVMMLATDVLRTALITTHLPLRDVPRAITPEHLKRTLLVIHSAFQQQLGISAPHMFIAGLNPHAGEQGHLGLEEIEIIEPTLAELRQCGLKLTGPLPADTMFSKQALEQADVFVGMYHDQVLPVLKYQGFGESVNVTLGLPFLRTSVDHGTALNLAATGKAHSHSLLYAVRYAMQILENSNR